MPYKPSWLCEPSANELQHVVRLAVNQHQIRPDLAIAVVLPGAGKRVISVLFRKRLVLGESRDELDKFLSQNRAVLAFGFPL
jgi:hypothetical protein